VDLGRLNKAERSLWEAFPRGEQVDLSSARAAVRQVRAEVIGALLLGAAPAEPGSLGAVRLDGARVTGTLNLSYSALSGPLRLRGCEFDRAPDLSGAHTRDLDLDGSQLPGLVAALATVDGNLSLAGCRCTGQVILTGTHVTGALQLQRSRLENPGQVALLANRLVVDNDLIARRATVDGELRLAGGHVGGVIVLDEAVIRGGGRRAFNAFNVSVGVDLLARSGFTAEGEVALSGARIGHSLDFRGAVLRNPGGVAVRCENTEAVTLVLGPDVTVDGIVDLRFATFTGIRDDPSCWPGQLRLSGTGYDTLEPPLPAEARVQWLHRDADGYLPRNYETLADMYRRHGDDVAARTVLLARERQRREQLPWYGRAWSWLQEITVGYGYRPLRAGTWLIGFLAVGTLVFGLYHPPPLNGVAHPAFNPLIYTLDLMVPLVNLGLRGAYDPQGPARWLAYLLVAVGWIFVTTIAAGIARVLRRQ
jgi:hypothetical protein